ncbi:MAG: VCBS repeat-containing protein [Bryobacteraceae bacterium]
MTRHWILGLASHALALIGVAAGQSIPSFAPPVAFSAPGASAAVTGDFNGDGRVDIVTANGITTGSHGVSILLSKGNGSFQPARTFSTSTDPTGLAVGDFNRDGKLDVAAINNAANTLSILLGNGDGTLQAAKSIVLDGAPTSIFAADFNADGRKDLVVVMQTSPGVYLDDILISKADGTFTQSTFPAVYGVIVADFNGDKKLDLALYGFPTGACAAIKFGNGDGTFTDSPLPFTLGLPFQVTQAVAGDFNGDGKMDLYGEYVSGAVTRAGFVFSTYTALGNGDGTFAVNSTGLFSAGIGGENLIAGDFNRDGKVDIAGVFPGPAASRLIKPTPANIVKILWGGGDGSFATSFSAPAGPSTGMFTGNPLVRGDFDGNGAIDFAWAAGSGINVIRNANGNPPLLSKLTVGSTFVVGGAATVSATVTIGDPAPAGGAIITLTASDPAAAFFPAGAAVTIPAGATSATFDIATNAVAAPEILTVTASWNGVNQTATFHLDPPFAVSSVTFAPSSLVGLFGGINYSNGTVTLSGPVSDGGAVVSLASSNPLVSVPATVTFAAGSTSALFNATALSNVAADTAVTVSAAFEGASKSGVVTVTAATDSVKITKAEYVVKTGQWRITATDTDATATIWVFNPSGTIIATLVNQGLGQYKGQGTVAAPFTTVVLQSSVGGFTTGPVSQK